MFGGVRGGWWRCDLRRRANLASAAPHLLPPRHAASEAAPAGGGGRAAGIEEAIADGRTRRVHQGAEAGEQALAEDRKALGGPAREVLCDDAP